MLPDVATFIGACIVAGLICSLVVALIRGA